MALMLERLMVCSLLHGANICTQQLLLAQAASVPRGAAASTRPEYCVCTIPGYT